MNKDRTPIAAQLEVRLDIKSRADVAAAEDPELDQDRALIKTVEGLEDNAARRDLELRIHRMVFKQLSGLADFTKASLTPVDMMKVLGDHREILQAHKVMLEGLERV